jgi:hypothetical protein
VFVLSGRGLCNGPIPPTEESYRLWCVSECDQVKINNLDRCCEQVEEGRTAKRNETKSKVVFLNTDLICLYLSVVDDKLMLRETATWKVSHLVLFDQDSVNDAFHRCVYTASKYRMNISQ